MRFKPKKRNATKPVSHTFFPHFKTSALLRKKRKMTSYAVKEGGGA